MVAGATTLPGVAGALWVLAISGNLRVEQQRRKTKQPGFDRGNAPLLPPSAASPRGGDFSGAMPCDTYEAEWEAESKLPSPGEVPPQAGIGVHFHRAAGPVCLFSPPDRAVLRFYQNWRRRRPPPPFEHSEPFEPSEPSRPKGVSQKPLCGPPNAFILSHISNVRLP